MVMVEVGTGDCDSMARQGCCCVIVAGWKLRLAEEPSCG